MEEREWLRSIGDPIGGGLRGLMVCVRGRSYVVMVCILCGLLSKGWCNIGVAKGVKINEVVRSIRVTILFRVIRFY